MHGWNRQYSVTITPRISVKRVSARGGDGDRVSRSAWQAAGMTT